MASITKRGKSYRIVVCNGYDVNGNKIQRTKTYAPPSGMTENQAKKEAEKAALEFENSIKRGLTLGGTVTLAAFADRWLDEHVSRHLEPTTAESYRHELKTKILPALGHMRLNAIQPVHIIAFIDKLLTPGTRVDGKPGTYSTRTIKRQYDILSSLFSTAVYWQILESSPCDRVKTPACKDARQKKTEHFSDEQAHIFLNAIQNEPLKYQLLATLGIIVGSRRGEVLALTWADVDLEKGEIDISKQHAYLPKKGIFTKDTKTSGSDRLVSIPASVITLLKRHKQEQEDQQLSLGGKWKGTGHLFTQQNGKPMSTSTPYQWQTRFIKQYNARIQADASLTDKEKASLTLPVISYHGLRHTSATLMLAGGTDIKTASARLGHASVTTTADIYAHQLRSADEKAANTFENTLGGSINKGMFAEYVQEMQDNALHVAEQATG